jgi:CheY-like chemotaxis protein
MATVLIAEDDVLIRDLTQAMIEDCDHGTLLAGGVDEALSILRQPTPIDVLFTDIRLDDAIYGGCELAREARALRPGIGIVYALAISTPP